MHLIHDFTVPSLFAIHQAHHVATIMTFYVFTTYHMICHLQASSTVKPLFIENPTNHQQLSLSSSPSVNRITSTSTQIIMITGDQSYQSKTTIQENQSFNQGKMEFAILTRKHQGSTSSVTEHEEQDCLPSEGDPRTKTSLSRNELFSHSLSEFQMQNIFYSCLNNERLVLKG